MHRDPEGAGGMCGSRNFCHRGSKFDGFFFEREMIQIPLKASHPHVNGISLAS